jgi:hypothetical protein
VAQLWSRISTWASRSISGHHIFCGRPPVAGWVALSRSLVDDASLDLCERSRSSSPIPLTHLCEPLGRFDGACEHNQAPFRRTTTRRSTHYRSTSVTSSDRLGRPAKAAITPAEPPPTTHTPVSLRTGISCRGWTTFPCLNDGRPHRDKRRQVNNFAAQMNGFLGPKNATTGNHGAHPTQDPLGNHVGYWSPFLSSLNMTVLESDTGNCGTPQGVPRQVTSRVFVPRSRWYRRPQRHR